MKESDTSNPPMKNPLATDTVSAWLTQALKLHQAGKLDEAKILYEKLLAVDDKQFSAFSNLGIILLQRGQHEEGLRLLQRSLEINPDQPVVVNTQGVVLQLMRRLDEAVASYDRALALRPDYAEAHYNRGNALQQLNRLDEAVASYDRALALRPDYAEAHYNRANTLQLLNRFDEAVTSYDHALALKTDFVEAYSNRGIALEKLNRHEEALASYDRSLALKSNYAETHNNRGNTLKNLGRLDEAIASYDRALTLRPDYAEAHYNRANALQALNQLDEALASFERAFRIKPDYPYLAGTWMHCKMHCCDWKDLDTVWTNVRNAIDLRQKTVTPFAFLPIPATPAQQQLCAQICIRDRFPGRAGPHWQGARRTDDRIRIGYFSSDIGDHPVSHLIAQMIEGHDRAGFEITGFSFGPSTNDAWRRRLEKAFDRFLDVSTRSDHEIAALARERKIDIAVDLNGFTKHARTGIFALRPAPVQANFLGYPGTLGADYMDYIIADATVIPEEHRQYYDEKIACLPHSFQPNSSTKVISDRPFSRAELGLPDDAFVFCGFNHCYKITPDLFDIWMRLLDRVGGSVLWLSGINAVAARNLRLEAEKRGIAPDRLVFAPRMESLADHLARQRTADLFLDTFYYNAHTTASDALWSGLPVLTCLGDAFAGRVAASLLNAVGLPELVTRNHSEYETLALQLATRPDQLAAIRGKLAANRATYPLYDTARYTRHIEAAYRKMHERSLAGMSPDHIVVDP